MQVQATHILSIGVELEYLYMSSTHYVIDARFYNRLNQTIYPILLET